MRSYLGIIQREKKYVIVFPDFPGCTGIGNTIDEVYKNGIDVLYSHINEMKRDQEKIPSPRTLEEIKMSKENWYNFEDAIIMVVPYIKRQEKNIRINISISEKLINKIDSLAKNRSLFIASAIEFYLVPLPGGV
jgi:predicted RNase H-like HicB family nuclease